MRLSVSDVDIGRLSERARDTLRQVGSFLIEGLTNSEIADALGLGPAGRKAIAAELERLAFEMRAQVKGAELPPLTADEYEALKDDIEARGQLQPILVDERGDVLDGANRLRICQDLDREPEVKVLAGLTPEQRRDVALAANLARRHITNAQRRELIAAELIYRPQASDRSIARVLGCSPSTVGSVRAELEEQGMVSKLDTRVGGDGVEQRAEKPAREPDPEPAAGERFLRLVVAEEILDEVVAGDWIPCEAIRFQPSTVKGAFEIEIRSAS